MLSYRHIPLLRDFAVVCQEGNLTKASQTLGTVQSAVTQRMQRLEDAVGARLLKRHSRGVAPTDQGLILLKYTRRLDDLISMHRVRSSVFETERFSISLEVMTCLLKLNASRGRS